MPEQPEKPAGKTGADKQRPDKHGADKQHANKAGGEKPRPEKKKGEQKAAAEKAAPDTHEKHLEEGPHEPARLHLMKYFKDRIM